MIRQKARWVSAFCLSFCMSQVGYAWGPRGHEVVNRAAAELSKSPFAAFLALNKDRVGTLSTIPDTQWKKPATAGEEKPMHFFQWDNYGASSIKDRIPDIKFTEAQQSVGFDFIVENGSAAWRVHSLYLELVAALKEQKWTEALQLAGVLGHYVGDMAQPMHATADYDGQSIRQPGVHKYFESTLLDRTDRDKLVSMVTSRVKELNIQLVKGETTGGVIVGSVIEEAAVSYKALEEVLKYFAKKPYQDAKLIDLGQYHMARGAATLALIWDKAFVDSGLQASDLPTKALNVPNPAWLPLSDEI